MGRLDNAMRRAAGEASKDTAAAEPRPLMDVRDLPPAEFPSEEEAVNAAVATPEPFEAGSSREPVMTAVDPAVTKGDGRLLPDLRQQVNAELDTKTVVDEHMMPASREQYRRLAAAFHQAQRANGYKVAMIASAVAGEGKSLTAANLALTLSESYRMNVLLIDADLRRPSQHSIFQVSGAPGLSEGLISAEEPKLPLHRLSSRLTVLPAGRPTSDPIGAITSDRMRRLIEEAREVFDWVIIDTPPVGLLTDASLLASMADGVVLVVKAESTPFDLVNRAVEALGRERMMGVVLNRAREQAHSSSYDYYKYYTPTDATLG
jgi:capsular exopolysaccharide synthesis family protein